MERNVGESRSLDSVFIMIIQALGAVRRPQRLEAALPASGPRCRQVQNEYIQRSVTYLSTQLLVLAIRGAGRTQLVLAHVQTANPLLIIFMKRIESVTEILLHFWPLHLRFRS
jgi:hypothetical protein